jgi:hypothetical protein
MYNILAGNQRALVFPVLCNGFVRVDYSDNVPDTGSNNDASDDIGYGLWAHTGSFTFESIVTPYDINGYGTHSSRTQPTITASKKIMSALPQSTYTAGNENKYQSELYLSRTARLTHEMRIFTSDNFTISLVNDSKHNENNPASFKIKATLKLGTAALETFETPVCILPSFSKQFNYVNADSLSGFDSEGRHKFEPIGSITSHSGATLDNSSNNYTTTNLFGGDKLELFYKAGKFNFVSLGTISTASSSQIVLTSSFATQLTSGTELFIKSATEPTYINESFHVGFVFNATDKAVNFYINGKLLSKHTYSETTQNFTFGKSDCFIGATGTGAKGIGSATTNKQFMGEMHELSIMSVARNNIPFTFNLLPNYNDTLLYLRFEEVDE